MNSPLVSIIIPLYNAERYIEVSVKSVINQTYKNIELIIIDDGSADNSLTISKRFEGEKVKVFHQQNKGASAARNKGLAEAKGTYIQFLDADDLISPDKIEVQVNLLQANPEYICTCPTAYFNDYDDFLNKKPEDHWIKEGSDDPVDFLIKLYGGDLIGPQYGGMIALHSWLCPRIILDAAGKWNEELSVDDDGEYFCRVMLASKGILHADHVVSYYRKYANPKSLSSMQDEKAYKSVIKSIDLKFSHLSKTAGDKEILNKIFTALYNNAAVATYPQFKELSDYAFNTAKKLWHLPAIYKAGPLSTFLAKVFGWRVMRRLDYYRHGK